MLDARAHLVEVTRAATDPALTARHAATMSRVAQQWLAQLRAALAELLSSMVATPVTTPSTRLPPRA